MRKEEGGRDVVSSRWKGKKRKKSCYIICFVTQVWLVFSGQDATRALLFLLHAFLANIHSAGFGRGLSQRHAGGMLFCPDMRGET